MNNYIYRQIKLGEYTAETAPYLGIITAIWLVEPGFGGEWFRVVFKWIRHTQTGLQIPYHRTMDLYTSDTQRALQYVERNYQAKILTIEPLGLTRYPQERPLLELPIE